MIIVSNQYCTNVQLSIGSRNLSIQFIDHLSLFRQLIQECDACLLVSPFLSEHFGPFIEGLNVKGKQIELVSTCAPRGTDQLTKPFALRNFGRTCLGATGQWPTIGLDQQLHSKVYIFFLNGEPYAGIISSANLTDKGLTKNHETGVLITDTRALGILGREIRKQIEYVSLSEYQIDKLCQGADAIKRNQAADLVTDYDIGLANLLNRYATPSAGNRNMKLQKNAQYFIKVSGVTGRPILPEHRMPVDDPHCQLSFATSPGNVRLGDCLLEVAVGGKCFLSYYACASTVFERSANEKLENPDHQRWPYYVWANNLSLNYGAAWYERPIYYNDVVKDFKLSHQNISVTEAGSDHFLGAMQLGHSYIQVTKEFGEYVRQRIDSFKLDRDQSSDL